jgi:hypothetical protein
MACPESPSSDELILYLMRQDPEHDAMCLSWNDNVARWSLEEVANVSRAVLQNRTVTTVPVNLTASHDQIQTSQILGCFQSVGNFQLACPFSRRNEFVSGDVVDSLLRGIAVSPSNVRTFETTRSGGDSAIIEFCQRFHQLESFALGIGYRVCHLTTPFEKAVSFGITKLTGLKRVSLFCSNDSNDGLSRIVTSLVASPLLEKAELIVYEDQLAEAARLCTYSRSLKEVTIESRCDEHNKRPSRNSNNYNHNDDDEEDDEEEADDGGPPRQTKAKKFLMLAKFYGSLEGLSLQNFHFTNFSYGSQPTIKSLTLIECNLEPGSLLVLQSFPNLARLKLSGCVFNDSSANEPDGPPAVPTPPSPVSGGDHAIRSLLRNLPNLVSFESTYLETVNNSEVSALSETNNNTFVHGIATALCHSPGCFHPSLRSVTLKLYGERVTESNRHALYFPALRQLMGVVETLVLYCTEFAWTNIYHLVHGLQMQQRISLNGSALSSCARLRHLTLHLEDCRVTHEDYAVFFRTVALTRLKSFCIDFDNCDRLVPDDNDHDAMMEGVVEDDGGDGGGAIENEGAAGAAAAREGGFANNHNVPVNRSAGNIGEALVELLRTNRTLETLELYYVNGGLFVQLLDFLMAGLRENTTLSRLSLQQNAVGSVLVPKESAMALLDLLRTNTSLRTLQPLKFEEDVDEEIVASIDRLLRLNRYGRKFLRAPRLSLGVWPRVLERIAQSDGAADVMYHFLRVVPALVRTARRSRRRNRAGLRVDLMDEDD